MTGSTQIVGIVLVRNEDRFVSRALTNIAGFCDRILVADHCSTDATPDRIREAAVRHPHVEYHRIRSTPESHEMIRPFAGTKTWVFAVDGDEIYDPGRLTELRRRIVVGEFDRFRQLYGNVLNCSELDEKRLEARGYLAPPCRTMTKLFNFGALQDWEGPCPQRTHGGRIVFAEGYDASMNCDLHHQYTWEESPFRCLHTVFLRRSSADSEASHSARMNVTERRGRGIISRLVAPLRGLVNKPQESTYKYEKYRRGQLVSKDVSVFFPHKAMVGSMT